MQWCGLPEVKRPLAVQPTHGMRLVLLLDRSKKSYCGTARTPGVIWEVDVALEGDVSVATDAPKDVAEYVRRVVRIAVRGAAQDRLPLPLKIHRWRAEKD